MWNAPFRHIPGITHDSQTLAPYPVPAATGNCPSDLGNPLSETFLGLHFA